MIVLNNKLMNMCDRVHRYARWIGGLSHQSSNLSCLCNLLQKVVIHASLDTRFKAMQVVTYLTNGQTTKVILTKGLGTCTWINKVHSAFWLYSCSMRGTDIARIEGLWLINRSNRSVPETQMTALRFVCGLLIYFPPQRAWEIIVMSFYDIRIICSILLVGKPLHMHRGNAIVHLPHLPASPPESPVTIATSKPHCLFFNLNFMPVTLSPRYFSVPLYQSLNLFATSSTKHRQVQQVNKNGGCKILSKMLKEIKLGE